MIPWIMWFIQICSRYVKTLRNKYENRVFMWILRIQFLSISWQIFDLLLNVISMITFNVFSRSLKTLFTTHYSDHDVNPTFRIRIGSYSVSSNNFSSYFRVSNTFLVKIQLILKIIASLIASWWGCRTWDNQGFIIKLYYV